MKSLILVLTMAFSVSTFAKDLNAVQTQKILKMLMANSATAKVVNKVPESKSKAEPLADLLATALTLSSNNDAKKCDLVVIANYYNVQADGSLVKDSESSYDFSFKVVKPVVPNPVLKIDGPVTVSVAD